MMKNLVILLIIILSNFSAKSQSSSDSTKLANNEIKTLLQIGDEWKRLSKEVVLLNDRSIILYEKIFVRDSLIASQKKAIEGYESVITGYQKSESNLIQQRTNLEKAVKDLNKKMKRQKTKTFITSLAGIIGMGAAAILLLK
ncbi:MAG: hypothetical protein LC100_11290 [Chitinophagales bacterium]|nr:hypothetical protein [Chitinophagales bacterium]